MNIPGMINRSKLTWHILKGHSLYYEICVCQILPCKENERNLQLLCLPPSYLRIWNYSCLDLQCICWTHIFITITYILTFLTMLCDNGSNKTRSIQIQKKYEILVFSRVLSFWAQGYFTLVPCSEIIRPPITCFSK